MGPFAGLDLAAKIFENTLAAKDQDHLPVALLSYPGTIPDRTAFLLSRESSHETVNPAGAIAQVLRDLDGLGAVVAGIPCNTSHSPAIFDSIVQHLRESRCRIKLIHMVREVEASILREHQGMKRVGILCTTGTSKTGLYQACFASGGLEAVMPEAREQAEWVHDSIYNPVYGIKAVSKPVAAEARDRLISALGSLKQRGCEAVVLGCTEIPLALPERELIGLPLIDPTAILARALIRETAPERLRDPLRD